MARDITELITRAAVVPERLKELEMIMKDRDGLMDQKKKNRDKKKERYRYENR